MIYQDLLKEIEYHESKGFYKIADSLTEKLEKYSVNVQNVSNSDLKTRMDVSWAHSISALMYQIPECSMLRDNPRIFEDAKNRLMSLQAQGKTMEEALAVIAQDTQTAQIPGLEDCLNSLGRSKAMLPPTSPVQ